MAGIYDQFNDDAAPSQLPEAKPPGAGNAYDQFAEEGAPSAALSEARRQRSELPSFVAKTDAFLRGVAGGIPFSDDIAALGDTATSYLPETVKGYIPGINQTDQSGEPFSQRYRENLARQRAIGQADLEDRPVQAISGQVAGAFALPMGAANRAAGAVGRALAPSIGNTASNAVGTGVVGAGLGALYGAGSGDSLGDRANHALWGAGLGSAAGAASPLVARGVGAAVEPLRPFLPSFLGGKNASTIASEKIGNALRTDAETVAPNLPGLGPADIRAAQATGQEPVLADIGGESTRGLARSAANTSPEARAAISDVANERFGEQGNRFSQFMQGLFGSKLNAQEARDAQSVAKAATNTPAYNRAYAKGANGVWDSDLSNMMQSPDMQDAVKTAMRKAQTDAVVNNQTVVKNPFTTDAAGNVTLAQDANGTTATPSLQFWDHVKRALDDKIGAAKRAGANDDVRLLSGLKENLVNKLDTAIPEYADARLGAFKLFQSDNALEAGEKFLGMSDVAKIDAVKSSLGKMTPEQRDFFAQGLASQIVQKAQNANERSNIVRLFNSPETREKMQLGLGTQRANEIEAFLYREGLMDRLRTSLGNSTTARQQHELGESGGHGLMGTVGQAASSPMGGAMAGAAYQYHEHGFDPQELAKGAIGGALGGMLVSHVKGVRSDIVKNIGEQLASSDPKIWQQAIKAASRNPQIMQGMRRIELGVAASGGKGGSAAAPNQEQMPPLVVPVGRASGGRIQRKSGGRVEPTEAQKEAGNYKKHHIAFQGMQIAIENRKGSERSGVGGDGKPWSVKMPADYGYIKRTEGADGDHVDVYVGPASKSDKVFVIDQLNDRTGKFDEHKCMLGFANRNDAIDTYRRGFSDGKASKRLGHVTEMTVDAFKDWVRNGDTTKPLAVRRASGGRVITADQLLSMADRAKKNINKTTEPLLQQPDELIVKALDVAHKNLEAN